MPSRLESPMLVDRILSHKVFDHEEQKRVIEQFQLTDNELLQLKRKIEWSFLRDRRLRRNYCEVIESMLDARKRVITEKLSTQSEIGIVPIIPLPVEPKIKSYAAEQRSPLTDDIQTTPTEIKRFVQAVNTTVRNCSGIVVDNMVFEPYATGYQDIYRLHASFFPCDVPADRLEQLNAFIQDTTSKKLNMQTSGAVHEGYVLPQRTEVISEKKLFSRIANAGRMLLKPQRETQISHADSTQTHQKETNVLALNIRQEQAAPVVGFVKGEVDRIKRARKESDYHNATVELTIDPTIWSEAEIAYMLAQISTILSGETVYTGDQRDKAIRRTLFLQAYYEILKDQYSPATGDDLVGLEEQLQQVETQLLTPLITGKGHPKALTLIGPPGTGKTLTVQWAMTNHPDIAFLPLPVKLFYERDRNGNLVFERQVARLQKISARYSIPVCVVIDDAEGLFGSDIRAEGGVAGGTSTVDRSRILQQLNGLGDSGFHVILTMNHPEILDAAAQRRMFLIPYELPKENQRVGILENIIPKKGISSGLRQKIIEKIAKMTHGFNSSLLVEVQKDVDNHLLYARTHNREVTNDLLQIYISAVEAIRGRSDIESLIKAEDVALSFLRREKRGQIGFVTPGSDQTSS